MHKGKIVFSGVLGALMLAALYSGGVGGCGGGGGTTPAGTTRNMTGTIAANSLAGLHLKGKRQTLACTDLQVCCAGYDGSLAVTEVEADCTFTLALPLNNFCYCDVFTGSDDDGNGCKETFVASLGCSEDGYSGAIPIFADDDDSVDDISIGTGTVEGRKVVSTEDPCAQVDEDDDGTSNEGDTDDDGDGSLDSEDDFNEFGCENADEFDSDDDDVPDIFQLIWSLEFSALTLKHQDWDSLFEDADSDEVPDFCDVDYGCEPDIEDTDGDCIPDDDDSCSDDEDNDGLLSCVDCDDSSGDVTTGCYEDATCDEDFDGDGVGFCEDCNDDNRDETTTFDEGCPGMETECELSACLNDTDCQELADDRLSDDDPDNDICEGNSVSCMECIEGCCEVTD